MPVIAVAVRACLSVAEAVVRLEWLAWHVYRGCLWVLHLVLLLFGGGFREL